MSSLNTDHLSSGQNAEDKACQFLEQQGMVKVAKNYRCKLGEIDLIMRHQETLVFVEVRLRQHKLFAQAAESVTLSKQKKLIKAAHIYLQEHKLVDRINCRFDVIAFKDSSNPEWIQNAFEA